jgi:hypothetical protein
MTNSQSKPTTAKVAERIQAQGKYCPPSIGFTKSAKVAAKKKVLTIMSFRCTWIRRVIRVARLLKSFLSLKMEILKLGAIGTPVNCELDEDHTEKKIQLITSVLQGKSLDSF